MIYVTGDTHSDYTRFSTENFPEQRGMTKEDFVIVCGDFGYWRDDREQAYWMDWLESKLSPYRFWEQHRAVSRETATGNPAVARLYTGA